MIQIRTWPWTEKTLIHSGDFYPQSVKTVEGRLRHYASHFGTVEADSSYYTIPYYWIIKTNTFIRTAMNYMFLKDTLLLDELR